MWKDVIAMKEHNTREIRAAARKLDQIASQLQTLKSSNISRISSGARAMKGDTERAIQTQLDSVSSEILYVKQTIANCASSLYEFARLLDIADEKSKAMFQSK